MQSKKRKKKELEPEQQRFVELAKKLFQAPKKQLDKPTPKPQT